MQAALADYAVMRGALVIRPNSGGSRTASGRYIPWVRWIAPGFKWQTSGHSDLWIIWRGKTLVVEVKVGDNTLSEGQGDFLEAAEAAGAVPVVAYSLDDLAAAMGIV